MDWLAGLYVNTLNLIQYMHDKYFYEAAEMALIDTDVRRTFATGIAGFSHVVDSLSAIKYAKVKTVRDETGLIVDFVTEGDFPRYGNDDDRADEIAVWLLRTFMDKLKYCHTYRDSEPTTSILTITSNVVYGKATGSLPDGRKAGEPLAPAIVWQCSRASEICERIKTNVMIDPDREQKKNGGVAEIIRQKTGMHLSLIHISEPTRH